MKILKLLTLCAVALMANYSFADGPKDLRGADIEEEITNVTPYQYQESEALRKNYRQQPPLIPHKIDKYQVNLKANQCLRCHSWPYNTDFKTVAAPESHYVDAQTGKRSDDISKGRWFCTQCHVPQSNAPELIENFFKPAE